MERRRTARTRSKSLPASSSKQIGRYAEGDSAVLLSFFRRTSLASFQWGGGNHLSLRQLSSCLSLAVMRKRTHERIETHRKDGNMDVQTVKEIRDSEFANLCEAWRDILEKPNTPGEFIENNHRSETRGVAE